MAVMTASIAIKRKGTNSERRKKKSIGIQRIKVVRVIFCLGL